MSLIKSISGIRGTIGGAPGEGLSPLDIVKFTAAYATFIRRNTTKTSNVIVVGRDARISGEMVSGIVVSTLCGMGFDYRDSRHRRKCMRRHHHHGKPQSDAVECIETAQ